jgi:hypothetical protein
MTEDETQRKLRVLEALLAAKSSTDSGGYSAHGELEGIGTYDHAALDTHVDDTSLHFAVGTINHTLLLNIGTNSHAAIDTHIADADLHWSKTAHNASGDHDGRYYTESEIDTTFLLYLPLAGGTMSGPIDFSAENTTDIGKASVGVAALDANAKVIIQNAAFGGGAASAADDNLLIKSATNVGINFVSAAVQAIRFSDTVRDRANITYDHSTDAMTLKSAGTTMVGLTNAGMILQVGVAGLPDPDHILDANGNVLADGGASASGTTRNGQVNTWADQGFGHELHYHATHGFCSAFYGRTTDTLSMIFGGYAANATAQNTMSAWGGIKASNGYWAFGHLVPLEMVHSSAKVRANGVFNHNGTDGITTSFSFTDGDFSTQNFTFSGGLLTAHSVT